MTISLEDITDPNMPRFEEQLKRHEDVLDTFNRRAGMAHAGEGILATQLWPFWQEKDCQKAISDYHQLKVKLLSHLLETNQSLWDVCNPDEPQTELMKQMKTGLQEQVSLSQNILAENYPDLDHSKPDPLGVDYTSETITEGLLDHIEWNISLAHATMDMITGTHILFEKNRQNPETSKKAMASGNAEFQYHMKTAHSQIDRVDTVMAAGLMKRFMKNRLH